MILGLNLFFWFVKNSWSDRELEEELEGIKDALESSRKDALANSRKEEEKTTKLQAEMAECQKAHRNGEILETYKYRIAHSLLPYSIKFRRQFDT